jgi:hypothetical protein
VTLAGGETPPAAAAAPPPPPVANAEPAAPAASPAAPEGDIWSFVPGAGSFTLAYGIPRTETGEFSASCRPGAGTATVGILRPIPGGQLAGPLTVTLAAGAMTRTYHAGASPIVDVAAGPHPQFSLALADALWTALIHETVLVVQLGQAPPYSIPLQGSASAIRQFLAACAGAPPVVAGGPPAVGAPQPVLGPPPGQGLPYDCNDGSVLSIKFSPGEGTALVKAPGAPPRLLVRAPAPRPDMARWVAPPSQLIGHDEIIRWSPFGGPGIVCRPRLPATATAGPPPPPPPSQ